MHGGQVFVLIIIAMALIAGIVKARYRYQHQQTERGDAPSLRDGESQRLRDEVRQLKERVQVLERITVEKESSLAREIEDLRSRP